MVSAYRSFCVLWAGLGCVTLSVPEGSGGSVLWRIQQYKYELKVDYMLITRNEASGFLDHGTLLILILILISLYKSNW